MRIKNALEQLASGEMSRVMTEQTLMSIGLTQDRIAKLIEDTLDGGIADQTIQQEAV